MKMGIKRNLAIVKLNSKIIGFELAYRLLKIKIGITALKLSDIYIYLQFAFYFHFYCR